MEHKGTKTMPTWLKYLVSAVILLFVLCIVATISSSKEQAQKLAEAKLKCQAIELMEASQGLDEPELNFTIAKNACESVYGATYSYDNTKFIEAVEGDFNSWTEDVAGHNRDWYLDQVKNQ